MRHAKSDWNSGAASDFERPLNDRGNREAAAMAEYFQRNSIQPDIWLSSSAKRAMQTSKIVHDEGKIKTEIVSKDELYLCNPDVLVKTLRDIEPEKNTAIVVGHNPGLEEFISLLISSGHSLVRMTTCTLAVVELSIAFWDDLAPRRGTLKTLISGKILHKLGLNHG